MEDVSDEASNIILERDNFYGCRRVNGLLFSEPLNFNFLAPPPPPPSQVPPRVQQEQVGSNNEGSSQRKKRDLIASRIVESKIATGKGRPYVLLLYECLNRRKMEAKEIQLLQINVVPKTVRI
ncbi:uncharacterized protein LOC105179568 [Sesamum indicum]|uniref:Uncharacterized protein LOC105179568 n=1 Tax=Sesamum indicum TaxID=4182 RepID=A0A6I9UIE9_SESIN|nr:uncharacterized protein LOC105179568 [Sesamum indicum]